MRSPSRWRHEQDSPIGAGFTVTGALDPAYSFLDKLFEWFMRNNNIRAGALAAFRKLESVAHRGYTMTGMGYPVTEPDSLFRLASLSKILTAAAYTRLVATGRLVPAAKAFPLLGVNAALPAGTRPFARTRNLTVAQLVSHRAGMPRDFDQREIARLLNSPVHPSKDQLVRYIFGLGPEFDPVRPLSAEHYSNCGYVVLTSVVEQVTGMTLLDFARREILAPLGLSRVWRGATAAAARLDGEVSYDATGTAPSQLAPLSDAQAPLAYGGAFVLENTEGTGGLVSDAPTMARLISHHAVWGTGGRTVGTRYGEFAGTWTCARSLENDIDYVFLFNRDVPDDNIKNSFNDHVANVFAPDLHLPPGPPPSWIVRQR